MIFAFGEYRLDLRCRELRQNGELVEIEPQAFDLLVHLVRHCDRVVSKDELIETVWCGRIVSDSALTSRLSAVRRAIGDTGATQLLIRTFARKGVRFVGQVAEVPDRAVREVIDTQPVPVPVPTPVAPVPDRPSIAVLPFVNLTGDRDQEALSEGTAEEVITALSRIRWLFVAARQSSFIYKNQAITATMIGRELGVRYLLEGSVRKAGNRIRVTAQLVETETGTHLWADHFDGSIEDAFALQDRVATSIAGVVEPIVQEVEAARSAGRPSSELTSFEAYLRAWAMHVASGKHIPRALALLEEAITRNPNYGPALGNAAVCCLRLCLDG
jgi:TolB-like protein